MRHKNKGLVLASRSLRADVLLTKASIGDYNLKPAESSQHCFVEIPSKKQRKVIVQVSDNLTILGKENSVVTPYGGVAVQCFSFLFLENIYICACIYFMWVKCMVSCSDAPLIQGIDTRA